MKSLKQIIQENLKFKINRDNDIYAYHPKTLDELRQIINDRYKELGPGTKAEPIDFNDIDVSGMTTFYDKSTNQGLFQNTKFEYIDVSNWNTSNVEYMVSVFEKCSNLKEISDLSNWNVSKIKNMEDMFRNCEQLELIGDLSKWDVSNVKNMYHMFDGCKKLTSIGDISNWDVSSVNFMQRMFYDSGITNKPNWY